MAHHIFISYVRDNRDAVDRLATELRAAGVEVWLDRERLRPGERWKKAVAGAIDAGVLFVACFSREYSLRDDSYMNQELILAIEALQKRPADRRWFVSAVFAGGEVPDRDIGGGETLRDLHAVDLGANWTAGVSAIARAAMEAGREQDERAAKRASTQRPKAVPSKSALSADEVRRRRTAFFVNLCGVMVQRRTAARDRGISSTALMSTIANVLIDWHCLATIDLRQFAFGDAGDLVWVPTRFGGTSRVLASSPHRSHEEGLGLFELVSELFDTDAYRQFGFKGSVRRKDGTYFALADFIAFDAGARSLVTPAERHFWELLADHYAALPSRQRTALASARTPQFSFLCMLVQFAYWRRDMRRSVDRATGPRGVDTKAFDNARAALHQLLLMPQYIADVTEYSGAQKQSPHTELAGLVPYMPAFKPWFRVSLRNFIDYLPHLERGHRLVKAGVALLRDEAVPAKETGELLDAIAERPVALPQDLRQNWQAALRKPPKREPMTRIVAETVDWISQSTERVIDLRIPALEPLYRQVLTGHYPLPRGQFAGEF